MLTSEQRRQLRSLILVRTERGADNKAQVSGALDTLFRELDDAEKAAASELFVPEPRLREVETALKHLLTSHERLWKETPGSTVQWKDAHVVREAFAALGYPAPINATHRGRPVEVEAYKIVARSPGNDGAVHLELENGEKVTATPAMTARYIPVKGDYWVIQEDGYTYVNPAHVFHRNYASVEEV